MECKEVLNRLVFFVDGELPLSETGKIQRHVEACQACGKRAGFEGWFRDTLGQLEYHQIPPGLDTRIQAALKEVDDQSDRLRFRAWKWASSLVSRPALGTAVAGLLVAMFWLGLPQGLQNGAFGPGTSLALAGEAVHVKGHLVCAGCSAAGVPIEAQRHCKKYGHMTGLLTSEGDLLNFVNKPEVQDLLFTPPMRGTEVEVEGRLYEEIGYIDVSQVTNI